MLSVYAFRWCPSTKLVSASKKQKTHAGILGQSSAGWRTHLLFFPRCCLFCLFLFLFSSFLENKPDEITLTLMNRYGKAMELPRNNRSEKSTTCAHRDQMTFGKIPARILAGRRELAMLRQVLVSATMARHPLMSVARSWRSHKVTTVYKKKGMLQSFHRRRAALSAAEE